MAQGNKLTEKPGISSMQAFSEKHEWWTEIFINSHWGWLIIGVYLLLLAWGFLNLIFPELYADTSIRVEIFSTVAAFVCSMLCILSLFSLRRSFWEEWWRRRVSKNKKGLSLEAWGPLLLIVFLIFILTYAVIRIFWLPEADSEKLLRKFILLLLYIVGFSSFIGGATIFIMREYIDWLNQKQPPPFFVDVNALADEALKAVRARLNTEDPMNTIGLERTANGGVRLTIERLTEKEEKGEIKKEIKKYEVLADERGQILSFKEQQKEI